MKSQTGLKRKAIAKRQPTPSGKAGKRFWPIRHAGGAQIPSFKSRVPEDRAENWLDFLRLTFDAVLLDCPAAETATAAAQHAALADVAVLVVEAGRTTRRQIQRDQRALQSTLKIAAAKHSAGNPQLTAPRRAANRPPPRLPAGSPDPLPGRPVAPPRSPD